MSFMDTLKGWFGKAKETAGEAMDKVEDIAEDIGEKAAPMVDKAKESAGEAFGKAKEFAGEVKDKVEDKIDDIRGEETVAEATEAAEGATDAAEAKVDEVKDQLDG